MAHICLHLALPLPSARLTLSSISDPLLTSERRRKMGYFDPSRHQPSWTIPDSTVPSGYRKIRLPEWCINDFWSPDFHVSYQFKKVFSFIAESVCSLLSVLVQFVLVSQEYT